MPRFARVPLDLYYQFTTIERNTNLPQLSQNGFRMEVDYTGYDYVTNKVIPYGTVELIGMKAEGIADISGINSNDYMGSGSSYTEDQNGVIKDYFSYANGYGQTDTYWYYNVNSSGKWQDLVFVAASYYASNGSGRFV